MNVYCMATLLGFIHNATPYIDIKGELTFDLYPTNVNVIKNAKDNNITVENIAVNNKARASKETTAAIELETTVKGIANTTSRDDCIYQIPSRKQVELLLSDMMNQLTKIFVRAFEYISRREARRNGKRFKIVRQKFDSSFFEQAYSFMSKEYRESINATADISRLAGHDPCHHQEELKQIWQKLLDHSKAVLKRAAIRCVSDFLRVRNRADDTRTKEKLGHLLVREIKEVRSNQIKVLCDAFKLCYKDLLH